MEPTTTYKTRVNRYRSLNLFIFFFIIFCLAECKLNTDEDIRIQYNIYLFRGEGNLNGGYSIIQKTDEHFYTTLVEQNPVEIYYNPLQILVIQKDNHGFMNYYKISIGKLKTSIPSIIKIKENLFKNEVKSCISCKEISLTLDTTKGMWIVNKRLQ